MKGSEEATEEGQELKSSILLLRGKFKDHLIQNPSGAGPANFFSLVIMYMDRIIENIIKSISDRMLMMTSLQRLSVNLQVL